MSTEAISTYRKAHQAELAADIKAHPTAELLATYRGAGCSEYNLREFLKDGPKQQERFRERARYEQENAGKYAPCVTCGGTVYDRVGNQCFACY